MTGSEQQSVDCWCYRCIGPIYEWDQDSGRYLINTVHVELCDTCGRVKSEFVDNYTKGHYECWWCNERAAGPFGPEPAPPTGGLV